jgi:hypothetical protein
MLIPKKQPLSLSFVLFVAALCFLWSGPILYAFLGFSSRIYATIQKPEHKQFLTIMAIKLNSVATYAVQRGKNQEVVLSDSESESEDHQNNDDGEMLP